MKAWFACLTGLALFCLFSLWPDQAQAASGWPANGLPDSARFGYGVRLSPQILTAPQNLATEILVAQSFNLDWLALDFDWAAYWPQEQEQPDWAEFDQCIAQASKGQMAVLLSITNAPAWAMNQRGPMPNAAARLVSMLAERYAGIVLAIELFPRANTPQGWGAAPDPQQYAALLKAADQAVHQAVHPITLVAAGLTPLNEGMAGMDDLEFLQALYREGATSYMPILGLRLSHLQNDPLASPTHAQTTVLRHYEQIRQIMLESGHESGLIWITGFSFDPAQAMNIAQQLSWLKQAYLLMRAQLYIGSAFFEHHNYQNIDHEKVLSVHQAIISLGNLAAWDDSSQVISFDPFLVKRNSTKIIFKVELP